MENYQVRVVMKYLVFVVDIFRHMYVTFLDETLAMVCNDVILEQMQRH